MAATHGGNAGKTILDMLEEDLVRRAEQYVRCTRVFSLTRENVDAEKVQNTRGQLRGVAISIAMMRHPLRRYDQAWWGYVKKLEKRAVVTAKSQRDNDA